MSYKKSKKNKGIVGGIVAVMATFLVVGGLGGLLHSLNKKDVSSNSTLQTSTSLTSNKTDLSTSNSTSIVNQEFSEFPFVENEILMSSDFKGIEAETKFEADKYSSNYELSYYNPLTNETAQTPLSNGTWEMHIKVKDKTYKRAFQYVISDVANLNDHFEAINDAWGNNSSVVCEASKIVKNGNTYSSSITLENSKSACLLSKYYYSAGKFDIYAKCNIFDYGCFAFWLTGIENEANNPNYELTMELFKTNQIAFSSSSTAENYKSNTITSNIDFTKWHKYSIDFTNMNQANFLIDDQVIYSISENLPTCEYYRVNIGLLYPQTGWTGKIENTQYGRCSMNISNFSGTTL